MSKDGESRIWVAVRVERGFPVEVRGFRKRDSAIRVEEMWRMEMNPDYDETEVLPLSIPGK